MTKTDRELMQQDIDDLLHEVNDLQDDNEILLAQVRELATQLQEK